MEFFSSVVHGFTLGVALIIGFEIDNDSSKDKILKAYKDYARADALAIAK